MRIKKKIYIFLGPPESGKGTQADMVGEKFKMPVISIGELLRLEINKKTKLGKSVKYNLSKGILIPDKVVAKILDKRLKKKDAKKGFILDGFPRREEQTNYIEKNFISKKFSIEVFYIDVSDKEVKKRIGGRRVCDCGASYHIKYNPPKSKGICDLCKKKLYQRKDDSLKVLSGRLKRFKKRIRPTLDYFRVNANLIKINGEKSISSIQKSIINKIVN